MYYIVSLYLDFFFFIFFFNDTATTEIYTLSLHDALPIYNHVSNRCILLITLWEHQQAKKRFDYRDRKSTRLNSSHGYISYAVFCLKKKKKNTSTTIKIITYITITPSYIYQRLIVCRSSHC